MTIAYATFSLSSLVVLIGQPAFFEIERLAIVILLRLNMESSLEDVSMLVDKTDIFFTSLIDFETQCNLLYNKSWFN